jgi:cytochrome c peroxidase
VHLGVPQGGNPLDGEKGEEMKGRILRYALTTIVAALAVWGVIAVHNWNARRAKVLERRAELERLGLPGDGTSDFVPLPAILPHNATAARIGADLFIDRRLARASRRTCSSCHWLNMGGADGKMHAGRLTRPFVNVALATRFLGDGSLTNIADVVALMIENGDFAGGGTLGDVAARLAADEPLAARFEAAYSSPPSAANVVDAIAQYSRTLLSAGRPFDRSFGGDQNALAAPEREGMDLFKRRGCLKCHDGPGLGGTKVHDGRKVSALRGLGQRNVYLSGKCTDIGAVLAYMPAGELDENERAAFVAFLKSL